MIKSPTPKGASPRSPTGKAAARKRITLTMQTSGITFLAILNFDDPAVFYEKLRNGRSAE